MDSPTPQSRKRARRLYIGLAVWILLIALALLVPAWLRRAALTSEGDAMARRSGLVPAPRGTVVDADGVRLAWSERAFDLFYLGLSPEDPAEQALLAELAELLDGLQLPPPEPPLPWRLRAALSPFEYRLIRDRIAGEPSFRVLSRTERLVFDDSAVRRLIGRVEIDPETGVVSGISGIEAEFDARLSGVPGEYRVALDGDGNWIRPSWELLTPVIPGSDVRLEYGWREWVRRVEGDAGEADADQ